MILENEPIFLFSPRTFPFPLILVHSDPDCSQLCMTHTDIMLYDTWLIVTPSDIITYDAL